MTFNFQFVGSQPRTIIIFIMIMVSQSGCATKTAENSETEVELISLAPPLDQDTAEISGLGWCGDKLILLPEKPGFESAGGETGTYLYSLEEDQIDRYLTAESATALIPGKIRLIENDIRAQLNEFDGYEAIACEGEQIWFSIETELSKTLFETNIVAAKWQLVEGAPSIIIDPSKVFKVDSQSKLENYSDEALLFDGTTLLSIHETNGSDPQQAPFATQIDTRSGHRTLLPFPRVAFRITDVTTADKNGYFWAINSLWWEEQDRFARIPDTLFARYGKGESHLLESSVERLLQFQLSDNEIKLVDQPPLQLKLTQENGRNWEGIARYRDKGLLIVSDMYPHTYLGYVPFTPSR